MNSNGIKRKIAAAFDRMGFNAIGLSVQRFLLSPYIRVVNYHDIRPENVANFESHLRYYADEFVNVDEYELRSFINGGTWPFRKPGLVISFDDGLTSHIETAAPLLEKYGFTGWFFVPAERTTTRAGLSLEPDPDAGVNVLTPAQVKELDELHIVGSHTTTHCRLTADLTDDKVRFETIRAKELLETSLGHEVNIFCWVGGEEFAYSKIGSDAVKEGYDLGFMTNNAVVRPNTDPLQIQRTNIEADNPLSLVRFQLAGFIDLMYWPKRKRVNKLTR